MYEYEYKPVHKYSAVKLVSDWLAKHSPFRYGEDGLAFVDLDARSGTTLTVPEDLRKFLLEIRLLRRIPLCYLVPDERLLPPESIRFFNVSCSWIDRVIDGVFAAANIGSVDASVRYRLLSALRFYLDEEVEKIGLDSGGAGAWHPKLDHPMTGMLMRSEMVRRWPDMQIEASSDNGKKTGLLRAEPISNDIFIALFAGSPHRVGIGEPHVGLRFGIESDNCVDVRGENGKNLEYENGKSLERRIRVEIDTARRLSILKFAEDVSEETGAPASSRMVALNLEQRPYWQVFKDDVDEMRGSVSPVDAGPILMRNGRPLRMDHYIRRFNAQLAKEK